MSLFLIATIITTVGGLIAAFSISGALKQKKSCASSKCRWYGDGFCLHKSPCVDGSQKCATYEKWCSPSTPPPSIREIEES